MLTKLKNCLHFLVRFNIKREKTFTSLVVFDMIKMTSISLL